MVQNINQHCQCGLSAECITEGAFQCFENSEQQVTFRARLHGTSEVTSSQLVAYLETYFAEVDSTIAIQGVRLDVDKSCPLVINSFSDLQCTTATTSDSTTTMAAQSDNTAAIIGGVVAVIVVVTIAVVSVTGIAAYIIICHKEQSVDHNVG